jgi:hypothetical protein
MLRHDWTGGMRRNLPLAEQKSYENWAETNLRCDWRICERRGPNQPNRVAAFGAVIGRSVLAHPYFRLAAVPVVLIDG